MVHKRNKNSKQSNNSGQAGKRVKLESTNYVNLDHDVIIPKFGTSNQIKQENQLAVNSDQSSNDEIILDQDQANSFRIKQKDKVEKKVELIFKDNKLLNNSLTIWGTGLDVEKTIGVVEELKRVYVKQGKCYKQETKIKTGDNNEPHLQVILTLLDDEDEDNIEEN